MKITQELLSDIVNSALKRGATEAEVIALETTEFSVDVRLGEVETLEESASRGLGLRVRSIRKHGCGEFSRPPCHFVQVAVVTRQLLAGRARLSRQGRTIAGRSEQRFPGSFRRSVCEMSHASPILVNSTCKR